MAELILERDKRLELRGQAHHLKARVLLGANGLTEAVEKEVSRIQAIGKMLVLWRPPVEKEEKKPAFEPAPSKKKVAVKKPGMKKTAKKPVIIHARPKRKTLTKKAALAKC